MKLLPVAVLALATFRMASLLADEDGPLGLLVKFRQLAGVQTSEHGDRYGTNNFATGFICSWCNSVWIGAAVTAAYYVAPTLTVWLALPLALSTVTIIIYRFVEQ